MIATRLCFVHDFNIQAQGCRSLLCIWVCSHCQFYPFWEWIQISSSFNQSHKTVHKDFLPSCTIIDTHFAAGSNPSWCRTWFITLHVGGTLTPSTILTTAAGCMYSDQKRLPCPHRLCFEHGRCIFVCTQLLHICCSTRSHSRLHSPIQSKEKLLVHTTRHSRSTFSSQVVSTFKNTHLNLKHAHLSSLNIK